MKILLVPLLRKFHSVIPFYEIALNSVFQFHAKYEWDFSKFLGNMSNLI